MVALCPLRLLCFCTCRGVFPRSQEIHRWACEGHLDVHIVHQGCHHGLQRQTGKGLILLLLFASVEELPGILMDPPQHIDHQCGSDPALQESFVVVQSVPDLYYTQKLGAFIAK